MKAVAVLKGDTKVSGVVRFNQENESAPVKVEYDIQGNDANAKRGFHVHQFGDNTNGCTSAGPHFNPKGVNHGAREDSVRHVGDLGNVDCDSNGVAKGEFTDDKISLYGNDSILGRTIVIHAGEDDLGKTDHKESKLTGAAGARNACGVIGVAN